MIDFDRLGRAAVEGSRLSAELSLSASEDFTNSEALFETYADQTHLKARH